MTTIVYRDGVMAADRLVTTDGVRGCYTTKIHRRADGALIGLCGNGMIAAGVVRWFIDGEKEDQQPPREKDSASAGGLIVMPDGAVRMMDQHGWMAIDGPFFALGSGDEFALAAMEMGADARQAVEIAIRRDVYSGGGIDVLYLAEATVERIMR